MEVMGELENALLESKPTVDYTAEDEIEARITYDSTEKRIKLGTGDGKVSIPTLSDIATLRDLMHAVGDVVPSMLDTADFQSQYSNNWLLLDGHGLYQGGPLPYLASDYPELATLKPNWVASVDLGAGLQDYLFIPDGRAGALVGADGSGTSRDAVLNRRPELAGVGITTFGSNNMEHPFTTVAGDVVKAQLPSVEQASFNYVSNVDVQEQAYGDINGDLGGVSTRLYLSETSASSPTGTTLNPSPSSGQYADGSKPMPQRLAVNFYIKARETV